MTSKGSFTRLDSRMFQQLLLTCVIIIPYNEHSTIYVETNFTIQQRTQARNFQVSWDLYCGVLTLHMWLNILRLLISYSNFHRKITSQIISTIKSIVTRTHAKRGRPNVLIDKSNNSRSVFPLVIHMRGCLW